MDDKTEELRDIFVEVTDEETVTERQEEIRGSLTESEATAERLGEVVARMRERYDFSTSLPDEAYVAVVEGFYAGEDDGTIADDLDVSTSTVFRARLDLHLVGPEDADAPFDLSDLRKLHEAGAPLETKVERLDASEATVERFSEVVEAQREARRVSDRFRSEFEDLIVEADLGERLTTDVNEDGLDEATDGMETDVSF